MTREEAIRRIKAWNLDSDDMEVLAVIIPELKENEDERIRMALIKLMTVAGESYVMSATGFEKERLLAYLEKQKEETENATKTLAKILEDSAEGFRRILKKKGIDYEVSDKFWENEAGVYSKEENVKFHKWMDDLMGPTPVEETNAYKKGLEAGMKQKEQKPKAKAKSPLSPHELYDAKIEGISQGRQDVLDHPEQFGLQKPAEWSEEDKRKLNRIYEILGQAADEKPFGSSKRIIGDKEAVELQDFIKSLRPSWKPSEEQMNKLKEVIYGLCTCGNGPVLKSLYEDLKKLI